MESTISEEYLRSLSEAYTRYFYEYDESALHNEVRATYFKPYIATRAAIQIEI